MILPNQKFLHQRNPVHITKELVVMLPRKWAHGLIDDILVSVVVLCLLTVNRNTTSWMNSSTSLNAELFNFSRIRNTMLQHVKLDIKVSGCDVHVTSIKTGIIVEWILLKTNILLCILLQALWSMDILSWITRLFL